MNADMKKCLILSGPTQLSRTTGACAHTRLPATHRPNNRFIPGVLPELAFDEVHQTLFQLAGCPALDVIPGEGRRPRNTIDSRRYRGSTSGIRLKLRDHRKIYVVDVGARPAFAVSAVQILADPRLPDPPAPL